MAYQPLIAFLDESGKPFEIIGHLPAYTAQEAAAVTHVSGWQIAKTIVVTTENGFVLAVLPAAERLDLSRLLRLIGAEQAFLASEEDCLKAFPGVDPGAVPPVGELFDLPVFVTAEIANQEHIYFRAGSMGELVGMRYEDFAELTQPEVGHFGIKLEEALRR